MRATERFITKRRLGSHMAFLGDYGSGVRCICGEPDTLGHVRRGCYLYTDILPDRKDELAQRWTGCWAILSMLPDLAGHNIVLTNTAQSTTLRSGPALKSSGPPRPYRWACTAVLRHLLLPHHLQAALSAAGKLHAPRSTASRTGPKWSRHSPNITD